MNYHRSSGPFPSAVVGIGDPIDERRELTRTNLAASVVGLLGVVILIVAAWFFLNAGNATGLATLLTGLFTPLVGLAGTVLGFYFGAGGEKKMA